MSVHGHRLVDELKVEAAAGIATPEHGITRRSLFGGSAGFLSSAQANSQAGSDEEEADDGPIEPPTYPGDVMRPVNLHEFEAIAKTKLSGISIAAVTTFFKLPTKRKRMITASPAAIATSLPTLKTAARMNSDGSTISRY